MLSRPWRSKYRSLVELREQVIVLRKVEVGRFYRVNYEGFGNLLRVPLEAWLNSNAYVFRVDSPGTSK